MQEIKTHISIGPCAANHVGLKSLAVMRETETPHLHSGMGSKAEVSSRHARNRDPTSSLGHVQI